MFEFTALLGMIMIAGLLTIIMMIIGFIWVIVRDILETILCDEDYTDYRGG